MPKELKVFSFFDFCIRCEEIYNYFWDFYAPFFDIAIYRDYLLENVKFSENKEKQRGLAGICWEFLMNDINKKELYEIARKKRK